MRNNRISFVRSEAFRIAWLNETTSCSNAETLPFVLLSKEDLMFHASPTWCGCDGYIGDEKAFVAKPLESRRIGFAFSFSTKPTKARLPHLTWVRGPLGRRIGIRRRAPRA